MTIKILKGHVSQETAYLVDDYPYGFRLRCKIRYWLEHHSKLGTRLWSQTSNPKRDGLVWNKPKASTYAKIAGAMYLDDEEHVQWTGLSIYDDAAKARGWLNEFQEGLTPEVFKRVIEWIDGKEAYETGGREGWLKWKVAKEVNKT